MAVGEEEGFGGVDVLVGEGGADLGDGVGAVFDEVAEGAVPDELGGFGMGGVDGGEGGDVGGVCNDVGAVIGAEFATVTHGCSVDSEVEHAFVNGVEVVAAIFFGGAEDFADAVFDLGGGAQDAVIEEAGFVVGLLDSAEGAKLEAVEAAESGMAADKEGGEECDEKEGGDGKEEVREDAPGIGWECVSCWFHRPRGCWRDDS